MEQIEDNIEDNSNSTHINYLSGIYSFISEHLSDENRQVKAIEMLQLYVNNYHAELVNLNQSRAEVRSQSMQSYINTKLNAVECSNAALIKNLLCLHSPFYGLLAKGEIPRLPGSSRRAVADNAGGVPPETATGVHRDFNSELMEEFGVKVRPHLGCDKTVLLELADSPGSVGALQRYLGVFAGYLSIEPGDFAGETAGLGASRRRPLGRAPCPVAPLRRCFAPVLRAERDAPRELGPWLRELRAEQIRSKALEGSHRPIIAHIDVTTCLEDLIGFAWGQVRKSVEYSTRQSNRFASFTSLEAELTHKNAEMHSPDPSAVESLLEAECARREEQHAEYTRHAKEVAIEVDRYREHVLDPIEDQCRKKFTNMIEDIQQWVDKQVKIHTEIETRVKSIRAEKVDYYDRNINESADEHIKELQRKMKNSERKQEKYCRQLKETAKLLNFEQLKYRKTLTELFVFSYNLSQIKQAHNKLLSSLDENINDINHIQSTILNNLNKCTNSIKSIGTNIIQSTVKHCKRILSELEFRVRQSSELSLRNSARLYQTTKDLKVVKLWHLNTLFAKTSSKLNSNGSKLTNREVYLYRKKMVKLAKDVEVSIPRKEENVKNVHWVESADYFNRFNIPLPFTLESILGNSELELLAKRRTYWEAKIISFNKVKDILIENEIEF